MRLVRYRVLVLRQASTFDRVSEEFLPATFDTFESAKRAAWGAALDMADCVGHSIESV